MNQVPRPGDGLKRGRQLAAKTLPSAPFSRGNDLMRRRIREVLLVSSLYEAFILQEDGNLYDQLTVEFEELRLSSAPAFAHATSAKEAFVALEDRRFDLLLVMPRSLDMDFVEFLCTVKNRQPNLSVVTLHFDNPGLRQRAAVLRRLPVDGMFVWSGDAKIFLALVKFVEDKLNLVHDIEIADIRVLLVVEDSIRHWSSFLVNLYSILMKQSQDLIADGLNDAQRLTRMRTRPKIILVNNYNEAVAFWNRFHDNILGVISDVGYERDGEYVPDAGIDFIRMVRQEEPDLPVLLQSAEDRFAISAEELGISFVNKNSPTMLQEIHWFMRDQLGFGDFVFRLASGQEVARAHDLRELEKAIETVPDESLEFHVRRNHFSNWLMARSEFEFASRLRPARFEDFASVDVIRRYLASGVRAARRNAGRGSIVDSRSDMPDEVLFERIGKGSLGGKGRGLAFLAHLLSQHDFGSRNAAMVVSIPKTFVVSTNVFDEFMGDNNLRQFAYDCSDDEKINDVFLQSDYPEYIVKVLRRVLKQVEGPLAVRSSSLLEDSMYTPFAGIYRTVMLANNHPDIGHRLVELIRGIKLVYASTFSQEAKAYTKTTPFRIEEEKMAVVIQSLVGQTFGDYFYPLCSGTALSYNYYPVGSIAPEDGVATLAFGMGRMVVDGGAALRFCPKYPTVLPHFTSPEEVCQHSQSSFFALRLKGDLFSGEEGVVGDTLERLDLNVAEENGSLDHVASIFDPREDMIFDLSSLRQDGIKVVTFASVLKRGRVPLAPLMGEVLELMRTAMGSHVEIEFACAGWQSQVLEDGKPVFHILQVRPIVAENVAWERTDEMALELGDQAEESDARLVMRSGRALGHGQYEGILDLVFADAPLDPQVTPLVADEIDAVNRRLDKDGLGYILVGPGRWGTSQPGVGIPVKWSHISAAYVIVEISVPGSKVEPSQGSHFFHNMTSMRIGYMTLQDGMEAQTTGVTEVFDKAWIDAQPAIFQGKWVKHIRLNSPFVVHFDGRRRRGEVSIPLGAVGVEHE